jgi:hypothetical protein
MDSEKDAKALREAARQHIRQMAERGEVISPVQWLAKRRAQPKSAALMLRSGVEARLPTGLNAYTEAALGAGVARGPMTLLPIQPTIIGVKITTTSKASTPAEP